MENSSTNTELLRLNRAYKVISKCNQAIVKVYDEAALMLTVCRIAVEDGGYLGAWAGLCDSSPEKRLLPLTLKSFPENIEYGLTKLHETIRNEKNPIHTAIKKGAAIVYQISMDDLFRPLESKSLIALPLKGKSSVIGVLTIYSNKVDAFSPDEQILLEELAEDLCFGIETARLNKERERYQKELQGLFQLNNLVDNNLSVPEILQNFITDILPNSMKYPDKIECSVEFDSFMFYNNPVGSSHTRSYSIPIYINKIQRGKITIAYPTAGISELTSVEYSVLQAFADKIGKFVTRIEAQELLESSKKRIQYILDSLPDIIYEIDRSMHITWANKKALEVNADALQRVCYTILHNRSKPCPNCPSKKALATGTIQHGSSYFTDCVANEPEKYYENIGVPIIDHEGSILGVIGIARDVTDSHQAKEKLLKYNHELRNLSHHLQVIREEERKNISREIHDELGQALTAIKMDAYWINKNIPASEEVLSRKTEDMLALVDDTVQNVQKLISDLRLGFPEDLDFYSSLEWEIEDFTERSGMMVNFLIDPFPENIHPQASISAFRILQESLTNILRHAKAKSVEIEIKNENNNIELHISDNGTGISEKELYSPSSYGIIGMRERCLSLGGQLQIKNSGNGTQIFAVIPINPNI